MPLETWMVAPPPVSSWRTALCTGTSSTSGVGVVAFVITQMKANQNKVCFQVVTRLSPFQLFCSSSPLQHLQLSPNIQMYHFILIEQIRFEGNPQRL